MDVRGYGKGEAIFKILWQLGAQFWDPKVTGVRRAWPSAKPRRLSLLMTSLAPELVQSRQSGQTPALAGFGGFLGKSASENGVRNRQKRQPNCRLIIISSKVKLLLVKQFIGEKSKLKGILI